MQCQRRGVAHWSRSPNGCPGHPLGDLIHGDRGDDSSRTGDDNDRRPNRRRRERLDRNRQQRAPGTWGCEELPIQEEHRFEFRHCPLGYSRSFSTPLHVDGHGIAGRTVASRSNKLPKSVATPLTDKTRSLTRSPAADAGEPASIAVMITRTNQRMQTVPCRRRNSHHKKYPCRRSTARRSPPTRQRIREPSPRRANNCPRSIASMRCPNKPEVDRWKPQL